MTQQLVQICDPVSELFIRPADSADVDQLYQLELAAFSDDRLSLRRLKHWIKANNRVFLVALCGDEIVGYGLVLLHRGTRLARLYSIAVTPAWRSRGLGRRLLQALEAATKKSGRLYMRLEVTPDNAPAIGLYQSSGYIPLSYPLHDYDRLHDSLRMQKRIRHIAANQLRHGTPWYQQTTDFTCGPASLMMAMASLRPELYLTQQLELDLWREATTIFMTSGHGGCHPVGLALAAHARGFKARSYINQTGPLLIDSVRNSDKKAIMSVVDRQFRDKARQLGVGVYNEDVSQQSIAGWLQQGLAVIMLISTYRMDGKKAPHWVVLAGIDDECLYVHDPDPDEDRQGVIDCQYIPIARSEFAAMSAFGSEKLRTCVVLGAADPD